ncbi:MAG: cytidylate kinase-like family protein [Bacteroidales bacterium]|nr:cytidylate kinase-like family protein [Bacteroidales bacterium]
MIITIARTLGSGGRQIGEQLAQRLGFAFYDKNLLTEAAQQSGINANFFDKADEQTTQHPLTGGLFGMRFPFLSGGGNDKALDHDLLFKLQSDAIQKIAERENAVILGRCADYVLRQRTDCLRVFLFTNHDDATKRVMERKQITAEEASELVNKTNKQRANYYNHYASKTWGEAQTYDICINTSLTSFEEIADSLIALATRLQQK